MAVVAVDFTHFHRTHVAGDQIPDLDPLVIAAPHLFVQPDPDPDVEVEVEPVRIRGPLVNPEPVEPPEPVDPPAPKSRKR